MIDLDERPTRLFKSVLFWGNGEGSCAKAYMLVQRLFEMFSIQSGIQQPPMATDPPEAHADYEVEVYKAEQHLHVFVRDVAMALTGKRIYFEDEVGPER